MFYRILVHVSEPDSGTDFSKPVKKTKLNFINQFEASFFKLVTTGNIARYI